MIDGRHGVKRLTQADGPSYEVMRQGRTPRQSVRFPGAIKHSHRRPAGLFRQRIHLHLREPSYGSKTLPMLCGLRGGHRSPHEPCRRGQRQRSQTTMKIESRVVASHRAAICGPISRHPAALHERVVAYFFPPCSRSRVRAAPRLVPTRPPTLQRSRGAGPAARPVPPSRARAVAERGGPAAGFGDGAVVHPIGKPPRDLHARVGRRELDRPPEMLRTSANSRAWRCAYRFRIRRARGRRNSPRR